LYSVSCIRRPFHALRVQHLVSPGNGLKGAWQPLGIPFGKVQSQRETKCLSNEIFHRSTH
jgi:hypothetical protein